MNIKNITPFVFLFFLLGLLAWELFHAKPTQLPSALIGENVPEFSAPNLIKELPPLTSASLKGRVTLLNVFASWCEACLIEHAMLLKIKNEHHIALLGLLYKDDNARALHFLSQYGNPYQSIGVDTLGGIAMDFGVYGTPETFVINSQGKIVYRHIGAIDKTIWEEKLYPLIKQLETA